MTTFNEPPEDPRFSFEELLVFIVVAFAIAVECALCAGCAGTGDRRPETGKITPLSLIVPADYASPR